MKVQNNVDLEMLNIELEVGVTTPNQLTGRYEPNVTNRISLFQSSQFNLSVDSSMLNMGTLGASELRNK